MEGNPIFLNINRLAALTGLAVLSVTALGQGGRNYVPCLVPPDKNPFSTDYNFITQNNGVIAFSQGRSGTVSWQYNPVYTVPASGRFSFGTINGAELDSTDNNVALTWGYPHSSGFFGYATIRTGDPAASPFAPTDSVYGSGGWFIPPYTFLSGKGIQSYTGVGNNMDLWMRVEMLQDTWKISFYFENRNNKTMVGAIRLAELIDMLSSTVTLNDCFPPTNVSTIIPKGQRPLLSDHIYYASDMPDTLEFYIDPSHSNPSMRFYLKPDALHPDQVAIAKVGVAGWVRSINGNLWDILTLPDASPEGTSIAVNSQYYSIPAFHNVDPNTLQGLQDPTTVPADMVFYISLAAGQSDTTDPIAVGTEAPASVNFNATSLNGLDPNPFPVIGKVTNLYRVAGSPITLSNVSLSLDLPVGFSLVGGTTQQQIIASLAPNETRTVTWSVQATGENTGLLPYNVIASVPAPTLNKVVTNNLVISANNKLVEGGVWRMDTMPFDVPSNQPIYQTLGYTNRNDVRVIQWDPIQNQWVSITNPKKGTGFFTKLADGTPDSITTLQNVTPPPGELVETLAVTLPAGWEQIGDPWLYPIYWHQVQFINPDNPGTLLNFTDAVGAGLLRDSLYEWDPLANNGAGTYIVQSDPNFRLQPMRGYFIKVLGNKPIQIVYPAVSIPGAGVSVPRSVPLNTEWNTQNSALWRMMIKAETADGKRANASFGVAKDSSNTIDKRDLDIPPSVGNEPIKMGFDHRTDWVGQDRGIYSQDIRSTLSSNLIYNLNVTTNSQKDVTLTWNKPELYMSGYTMKLVDVDSNISRSMTAGTSYRYHSTGSHRFQVVLTK